MEAIDANVWTGMGIVLCVSALAWNTARHAMQNTLKLREAMEELITHAGDTVSLDMGDEVIDIDRKEYDMLMFTIEDLNRINEELVAQIKQKKDEMND